MKILIVETAYPLNSRTERFYQSFVDAFGYEAVEVVCWNRDNRDVKHNSYRIFSKAVGYGDKKAKLLNLKDFYMFLKKEITEIKPDIILASHWDSLILATMTKPKNCKLIYENLDMPTGGNGTRIILTLFEKFALKKSDCITHASRFFTPFYKNFKGSQFVIENKLPKSMCVKLPSDSNNNKLTLTFLGSVRHEDIKKNLIKAIDGLDNVEFKIFGGGTKYENVKGFAANYKNVTMYGRYDYNQIPNIYRQSDVIWAAYPYNDYNVKYAISNKFHETLYYGVPGIFSKNTKLGDLVEKEGIGFTVDCYSVEDINKTIKSILDDKDAKLANIKENIKRFQSHETDCWEDEIEPFINYLKEL